MLKNNAAVRSIYGVNKIIEAPKTTQCAKVLILKMKFKLFTQAEKLLVKLEISNVFGFVFYELKMIDDRSIHREKI